VGGQQGSLILVGSPRTPAWVAAIIEAMAAHVPRHWLPWRPQQSAECERQYASALAHADGLAVTADSVNLVSEASASGKPVTLIGRSRARGRVGRFCDSMVSAGYCQPLENADYSALQPTACLRETEKIAHRLLRSGLFA
jgi:mitochondrial fission protein ELM1